jgi:hypothetical protein
MNEIYLKKIDETIEAVLRKKSSSFSMEMLINYIINKINVNISTEETTSTLENILIVRILFIHLEINSKWIWINSKNLLLLFNFQLQS